MSEKNNLLNGEPRKPENLRNSNQRNLSQLVLCAVLVGLAAALGMVKLFHLPFGGSITLLSMLAATLCGYFCGTVKGLISGLALGLLNFILGPYIVHPVQVIMDYFLAYTALGLSGLTRNKPNGLISGYLIAVAARYFFSFLSGYIFFGAYAPEGWNPLLYSFVYQFFYLGVEAVITVIILMIPAVKNNLQKLKSQVR